MQGCPRYCLTVVRSEMWRPCATKPGAPGASTLLCCVAWAGLWTASRGTRASQMRVHSPLSSHDSDWNELRDCTSHRLSRALYALEGFSSSGFLERQGSRSTTLAKRRRRQTNRYTPWRQRLCFLPCCILTQSERDPQTAWDLFSERTSKEKTRNIWKTKPKTYKYSLQTHRIEIRKKPASGYH